MPMYHIMKAYVPILTLLIIVELTLFFDESRLQVCKLFFMKKVLDYNKKGCQKKTF